jgi:aryl-alcohol dehydrogenase-like predicted oxidoreductase
MAGFVSLQNPYSLLEREIEADVIPECRRLDVSVIPYSPLADGLLTGKYRRGEPAAEGTRLHGRGEIADEQTFDRLDAMRRFAEARGIEMLDVAIGWLAAQPMVVSVIAGATTPEQVRSNARAVRWEPSDVDLAELDAIFPPAQGSRD